MIRALLGNSLSAIKLLKGFLELWKAPFFKGECCTEAYADQWSGKSLLASCWNRKFVGNSRHNSRDNTILGTTRQREEGPKRIMS